MTPEQIAHITYQRRTSVPEYIITALEEWHAGLVNDLPLPLEQAELADKVHYWLTGKEEGNINMPHYENAPAYVNDPSFASIEDVKHHNTPAPEEVRNLFQREQSKETVFIVDGESDPDNPLVVEVVLTRVLQGEENYSAERNYLKTLLGDLISGTGFNMEVVDSLDATTETISRWRNL